MSNVRLERWQQVKADQADQENDAADRQINGDFPGGALPIARSPDPDHEEGGNQRQFVKRVKEEQIERSKCSGGSGSDQEDTGVISVLSIVHLRRQPNRGELHDGGQEQECCAQTVDADEKLHIPAGDQGQGTRELVSGLCAVVTDEYNQSRAKRDQGSDDSGSPRGQPEKNADCRDNRGEINQVNQ